MTKKQISKKIAKEKYGIITAGANTSYKYYLLSNGNIIDSDGDVRYIKPKENNYASIMIENLEILKIALIDDIIPTMIFDGDKEEKIEEISTIIKFLQAK